MNRFIVPAEDIPRTLYRIQHAEYHIPKGATKKGIYALNSDPKEPLGVGALAEEADNHFCITQHVLNVDESQWPSPFISVFSTREDAEAAAKVGTKKLEGAWNSIEISGAGLAARRTKIFRAKDVKGEILPASDKEYLIWRLIPEEAIINMRPISVETKVVHWLRKISNGDVEFGCAKLVEADELIEDDVIDETIKLGGALVQRGGRISPNRRGHGANYTLGSGHMLAGSRKLSGSEVVGDTQTHVGTQASAKGQSLGSQVTGDSQPTSISQASSVSQTQSDQVTEAPAHGDKIVKIIEHWPENCNVDNTKSYYVRWEGDFRNSWIDVEKITDDEMIDEYWESRQLQKKRKRGSNSKPTSNKKRGSNSKPRDDD